MHNEQIPHMPIEGRIYMMRKTRVMLDSDLAALYRVPIKALIQAVKRNQKRFPSDFIYLLTREEVMALRSQSVTLENAQNSPPASGRGKYRKFQPYAFTEQGVAMLSSVLHSERAIQVNIQIMRIFVSIREQAATHQDLWLMIDAMEKKYDTQFQVVFKSIKLLIEKPKDGPEDYRRF